LEDIMTFPASLTALAMGSALALFGAAQAAPLSVDLSGIEARGGTLYVSVQTEAQFTGDEGTAGEVVEAPDAGARTFAFDVPPGAYAVSVWHDDDGDGEFTMGPNFMPLDGWAMSGPALQGPPRFGDVAVEVDEDGARTALSMTYGR
jgi:uncharacterized protein (DUF2141 family)